MSYPHYLLSSLDAIVRILIGFAVFFVFVPRWIFPAHADKGILERLWWNLGVGITALVLIGQFLTLFKLYSILTLALCLGLAVLVSQAIRKRTPVFALVNAAYTRLIVTAFHILDGKINLPRRFRRWIRSTQRYVTETFSDRSTRLRMIAWTLLTIIAAGFRFYRPLLDLDLGLSDAYVHLYWLKLLEIDQQVDPAWGPYPRGLHFVLLAIRTLTNVDDALLVNFFGAFVGVLMVLSVADVAGRISRSARGGWLAGFVFATMVGGAGQYWVIGGSYDSASLPAESLVFNFFGHRILYLPETIAHSQFDLMFGSFLRQTVTLPQELAVVLLFPTGLFLLDYFRRHDRWYLYGYAGGAAAIAATHPGVGLPLALLVIAASVPVIAGGYLTLSKIRRVVAASFVALLCGFTWTLGFFLYPRTGDWIEYAPFLRRLIPEGVRITEQAYASMIYPNTTRALIAVLLMSVLLAVGSFYPKRERRGGGLWMAIVTLLLAAVQLSTVVGLPTLISPDRNAVWLLMAMSITVLTTASKAFDAPLAILSKKIGKISVWAVLVLGAVLWSSRIPNLTGVKLRDSLINRTAYGTVPRVVLSIERRLEPFTWTMVTYGQEFPQVWGRGYHIQAADFLARYAPVDRVLKIPTPYVFLVVEKTPHPFQIHAWARDFSRADVEQRLLAWCVLYQLSHDDMKVFVDEDDIRVYVIERSRLETEAIARSMAGES